MDEKGRWETCGQSWTEFRTIRGYGAKPPHELQPVREKLTESVAQPCSTLCSAKHNFKISTSECIWPRYPPKCAFSRVNNEKFSGEGAQPPPQTPLVASENWYPPTFWNKVTPLDVIFDYSLLRRCVCACEQRLSGLTRGSPALESGMRAYTAPTCGFSVILHLVKIWLKPKPMKSGWIGQVYQTYKCCVRFMETCADRIAERTVNVLESLTFATS